MSDEKLAQALRAALPYVQAEAAKYIDDGSNEPLELARGIEELLKAHESRAQPATHDMKCIALITANQAQTLLDAFGGSPATYALMECAEGECAPLDDGSPSPAGLYIYHSEYPEEGVIYLGDEDEDSEPRALAQPASVPDDVREGINGPWNACCFREHCRKLLAGSAQPASAQRAIGILTAEVDRGSEGLDQTINPNAIRAAIRMLQAQPATQSVQDMLGAGDADWREKVRPNLTGDEAVLFAVRDIAEERRLLAAEVIQLRAQPACVADLREALRRTAIRWFACAAQATDARKDTKGDSELRAMGRVWQSCAEECEELLAAAPQPRSRP